MWGSNAEKNALFLLCSVGRRRMVYKTWVLLLSWFTRMGMDEVTQFTSKKVFSKRNNSKRKMQIPLEVTIKIMNTKVSNS